MPTSWNSAATALFGHTEAEDLGQIAGVVVLESTDRFVLPTPANDQGLEVLLGFTARVEDAHAFG